MIKFLLIARTFDETLEKTLISIKRITNYQYLLDWLTFGNNLIFQPHVNRNQHKPCRCQGTQNEAQCKHKRINGLFNIFFLWTKLQKIVETKVNQHNFQIQGNNNVNFFKTIHIFNKTLNPMTLWWIETFCSEARKQWLAWAAVEMLVLYWKSRLNQSIHSIHSKNLKDNNQLKPSTFACLCTII